MRIKPEIGTVVGPSDSSHWGQVILSPTSYGVIEVEHPADARAAGVKILTTLSERLATPPVSLAVLTQLAQEVTKGTVKTLILLVPVGRVVYIVVRGKGSVFLKRGSQVAQLLTSEGNLSGEVTVDDTLLLVSASVQEAFSKEELAQVFDHLNAKEAAEKLTLLLHTHAGGGGAAALIFQVGAMESTEKIETEPPSPITVRSIAATRPMETIWRGRVSPLVKRALPSKLRNILRALMGRYRRAPRASSVVAVIFILLFVTSVILGMRRRTTGVQSAEVVRSIEQAQYAYEEGVALRELNPVKARARLAEAKSVLEPFISLVSDRSSEGKTLKKLYAEISEQLTSSLQITVTQPTIFFDVSLLKKDATVTSFSLFEDTLGIVDSKGKTTYALVIPSKNGQIVAGVESLIGGTSVALYGNALYVFTPGGVQRVTTTDKKISLAIGQSDEWGAIVSMAAYGGNLYLLDTQKSRIWKYVATLREDSGQAGFSELREYLNPDTLPDLRTATSMAIDGSVWVGTKEGSILRFTQGRENTFVPQGVEPALGGSVFIYTSDTTTYLYVLEPGAKRVVVLDKEGFYLAQYTWEGLFAPTQLVVSEEEKKMLLLAEGKIYAIDLK